MLVDARSIPAGEEIEADVCIIGAGAAGISLALELSGSDARVCLLESGGFEASAETQDLNDGENVGHLYFPLIASRLRQFGGSTNHWGGWCRPLDPDDFEERAWIPHSGWPLSRGDLDRYYERAHELCQVAPADYDAQSRSSPAEAVALPLASERIRTEVFLFSPPTRFGSLYRDAVVRAPNVRSFLHANVTEIEPARDAGRISTAHVATLAGNRFSVASRIFVVATGGIENARLLLASRRTSAGGVGNAHDLVGRYFMEHPHLDYARFLASDADFDAGFYMDTAGSRPSRIGALGLTPELRRKAKIPGFTATLGGAVTLGSGGFESFRLLIRSLRQCRLPDDLTQHLRNVIVDFDDVAEGSYRRFRGQDVGARVYRVMCRSEQVPNPQSRVTLADESDGFGVPRARLDWRLTDQDVDTLRRGQMFLAAELARLGLGRMQLPEEEDFGWDQYVLGGHHHMGTTRMARDPRRGVVDADCRVHGIENLYVAGSSVFPTGGFANPTLTLVALAVRLADHVRRVLS